MSTHSIINYTDNITPSDINQYLDECTSDYIFIVNTDNIEVINDDIYNQYIQLMETFNQTCTFYGYNNDKNKILDIPNPALNVKLKSRIYTVIRHVSTDFICIKVKGNPERLDPSYKLLWLVEYLYRLGRLKLNAFSKLYFEVFESWTYFKPNSVKSFLNNEYIIPEAQQLNKEYSQQETIDEVIEYIKRS